jgi:cell division protein FtsW (lipid II flippase)
MTDGRLTDRRLVWLGVLLLVVGFLGHFFAARAIGGTYIAFRDHIGGFFLILVVTGAIIAVLGRLFWRTRNDITVLIIGVVQALIGIAVYIGRFSVHG